jgi:polysaccharide export outer membrane protein
MESHAAVMQQDYVIGIYDSLGVSVWQQPGLSVLQVAVRPDGNISMPLIDNVHAAGLTTDELKAHIGELLAEYITAPHVTVVVQQINSKNVYLIGEVKREGTIKVLGGMRVVDALSVAGGFATFADKRRVKVIRHIDGTGQVEFNFNYVAFVDGKDLNQNILLLPGDRIVVPEQTPFWR